MLATCVPSWAGRLLVVLPRALHIPALQSWHQQTTNTLEQALFICAFGSGCLAYYISKLTRQLLRQNSVRL